MMKKALSIVLSVLMILSACVVAFALEGDNEIPALTVNIYTHGSGSSAVSLYYGDSTYRGKSIREYSPGNEDITVNVYTPFRDQVTDAVLSGLITGTEVPAGYGSLMTGAESVSGIKNFVGAAVCQDDIPVDGSVVAVKLSDIKTIADTAAKNAARAAAQGFVDALNAGGIEILSSSVGAPTVTAKYGGYATDNAFIATYKPSVTETVSVWVNTSAGNYTIQGFIDLENKKLILNGDVLSMLASNVTGPAVRSMFSGLGMPIDSSNSADITKLLKDSAYDAAKDAVTVVFDHLSALAEAKAAAKAELAAYKSAEDYRAAEREDLSAAIAAGSAAIAAAADVEAVAAALADAKAVIDGIRTDAALSAEEAAAALAADKAAFEAYKTAAKTAAGEKAAEGDSAACRRLILNAKNAITALEYDESKTLEENKAAADAILAKLDTDLAAQREADAAAPEEEEEETPCPLCGGKHGRGTIGRLIRVIHRIVALIKDIYGVVGKLAA